MTTGRGGGTIHEKRIPACVCTCYGAFYAPRVRSPGTAIAAGPEIEILRESMRGAHRLHTYATTFHTSFPRCEKRPRWANDDPSREQPRKSR